MLRTVIAGSTALIAINLWTGAPIFALWVGSLVVGEQALSMQAVMVVVVVLAACVYGMAWALAWLDAAYDRLVERPQGERRLRWLRSMGTHGAESTSIRSLGALEVIVISIVYVAMALLVVWFFFFAGSPLG